jgi:superfamily II DNA/RNA helicase
MVVNYDLPTDYSQYIHRIGRSGRFGRKGIAINLIVESEWTHIEAIKKEYNTNINELPPNFEKHIII